MLTFAKEGMLVVEPPAIRQLSRSTASVTLDDQQQDAYEIHCVLCTFQNNAEQQCQLAFYAKTLKRGLVFSVNRSSSELSWQYGQELLARLGFNLEDVNLKLSPALLEVVLRDVPGFATPGEARKQQDEKTLQLAQLQKTCDQAPDSPTGKKASLKLNAEKHHQERLQELRIILERLLLPAVQATDKLEVLNSQVEELQGRLLVAEALVETERRQRELSEAITAAAEKRIQELEQNLVDVETSSAEALKQKRKATQLRRRVKELDDELANALQELAGERDHQERLTAELKVAEERLLSLHDELHKAGQALAEDRRALAAGQAEKTRRDDALKQAEESLKRLREELAHSAERAADLQDGAVIKAEQLQARLDEALQQNTLLDTALQASAEQNAALTRDLRHAEESSQGVAGAEEQLQALTAQHAQLTAQLTGLRDAYEQECRIRQELEAAAADDAERIRILSASLDAASPVSLVTEPGLIEEVESLKVALQRQADRLDEAAKSKEEVEIALHQAHDLIDSLEKMIRETAGAADGDPLVAASREKDALQVLELQEQLRSVEGQLDRQRAEQDRLAEALAAAEKQLAARQALPSPGRAQRKERRIPEPAIAREAIAEVRVKSATPLPHELRPAPKKGAPFHPDWDLPGLPCRSAAQVDKAWETAFNVQISLEGYPSQYCMAFLVVLGTGTQKQLYMLFRLKKNKHTLVYVPAKTPEDEASLQKAISDGLKYLKRSGFEMEEIAVENIDSALGSYFQGV